MTAICLDTETTGLFPYGKDADEILTLSIIRRDGTVLFDEAFCPAHKTSWEGASRVNGIYPADVAGLPPIADAVPVLQEIFSDAEEVIGYNVEFDLAFLAAIGVVPREDALITDTMREYAYAIGEWDDYHADYKWYRLTVAARHIGYKWRSRAHTSLADAYATLAVQKWVEEQETL